MIIKILNLILSFVWLGLSLLYGNKLLGIARQISTMSGGVDLAFFLGACSGILFASAVICTTVALKTLSMSLWYKYHVCSK